jgi:3',5'-cyclic AMP phosphodiesterase CpdA
MVATFSILHISDLHFGQSMSNPSGGLTGVANSEALTAVRDYLFDNKIDLVVATGDLATDGHIESLRNAREFLMKDGASMQRTASEASLARNPRNLIIVPGNHDRFLSGWLPLMRSAKHYIHVFPEFTHQINRVLHAETFTSSSGFTVRTIAIDSCAGTRNVRIARGRIHKDDLLWIKRLWREDRESSLQIDVRLLALHHHLTVPEGHEFKLSTQLRDRRRVVRAMLRGGIDLALYGHEHKFRAWSASYKNLIDSPKVARALSKDGWDLAKPVGLCLCGTTAQHGADAHTAYRIDLTRHETGAGNEYEYAFTLLSSVGGRPLKPFAGNGHRFRAAPLVHPPPRQESSQPLPPPAGRFVRGLAG